MGIDCGTRLGDVNAQPGAVDRVLPRSLSRVVLVLGTVWLGFVASQYLLVDAGGTLGFAGSIHDRVLTCTGLLVLAAGWLGHLLGRAQRRCWRGRPLLAVLAAVAGLLAVVLTWERATFALAFTLWEQPDGLRATVLLGVAMTAGAGVFHGLHRRPGGACRQDPSRDARFWTVLTVLPFLAVTVLAGALLELAALSWGLCLAGALGAALLQRFGRSSQESGRGPVVVSIAVGLGVLILLTLGLGHLGWATPSALIAVLVLLTILLARQLPAVVGDLLVGGSSLSVTSLSAAVAHAGLVALFCIYWLAALAPELGPDALGFRTAGPAIWLREGAIRPLPEMLGSYGYFAGEMLYLLWMPLLGLSVAKLVQFGLLSLLLTSVRRDVLQDGSGRGALWMFGLFASSLLWVQVAWGFVDVCQLFFCYAAIVALQCWLERGRQRVWLYAAGMAIGVAASIKLNGGMIAVVAGGVVLVNSLLGAGRLGTVVRNISALLAGFLLSLLPWMVQAYLVTENPAFPFLNGVFKSPLLPSEAPAALFPGAGPWQLVWQLFFERWHFVEIGDYHPVLLAILPVGLLGLLRPGPRVGLWGCAALVCVVLWAVTEQNARYSLFAALFLGIVVALGLRRLCDSADGVPRAVFLVVTGLFCLLGFGIQVCRPSAWMFRSVQGAALPTRVTLGTQTADRYLTDNLPSYSSGRWLNQHGGDKVRLWQVSTIRDHLYFEAPATSWPHGVYRQVEPLAAILHRPELATSLGEIHRTLTDRGYTHLLYRDTEPGLHDLPEVSRRGLFSPAFTSRYLRPRFADRGYRLYEILPMAGVAASPAANVLGNPSFTGQRAGLLPAWESSGSPVTVAATGDRGAHLRLAPGDSVSQEFTVRPQALYSLRLALRVEQGGGGYALFRCHGADGELLLFCRRDLPSLAVAGTFEYLQTAPAGAAKAFLTLVGGEVAVQSVELRLVR